MGNGLFHLAVTRWSMRYVTILVYSIQVSNAFVKRKTALPKKKESGLTKGYLLTRNCRSISIAYFEKPRQVLRSNTSCISSLRSRKRFRASKTFVLILT